MAAPSPHDLGYDRSAVTTGIVHLGVGAFHRAHQAVYVDDLMRAGEALDWGITGVGVMPGDDELAAAMNSQDCLYTQLLKHPDGHLEARTIGSIVGHLYAPDDPEAVLGLLAAPSTRLVTMTVTEGGYHVHPVTRELHATDADLAHDLRATDEAPRSAFGYLVQALARRRDAGTPAFDVVSCDNIQGNGSVARRMLVAFARLRDPELADWIDAEVSFPSSMVDRITPVTTDADRALLAEEFGIEDACPVVCEPFTQWVLEDELDDRPPLEDAGVQVVPDVAPYELMKLRLLNASHQALCYLGRLAGYQYAHEVCQDQLFVDFLLGYMADEGTPTLPPVAGVDLELYRHQLVERFANPGIRDTLARLCAESSDRIPQWLIPVVRERLEADGDVRRSALVVASWARYAEGADEEGQPIDVVDRRKEQVMARAAEQRTDPLAFLRDPDLFGDLVDQPRFTEPYAEALALLHDKGAVATLTEWQRRVGS